MSVQWYCTMLLQCRPLHEMSKSCSNLALLNPVVLFHSTAQRPISLSISSNNDRPSNRISVHISCRTVQMLFVIDHRHRHQFEILFGYQPEHLEEIEKCWSDCGWEISTFYFIFSSNGPFLSIWYSYIGAVFYMRSFPIFTHFMKSWDVITPNSLDNLFRRSLNVMKCLWWSKQFVAPRITIFWPS